MNQKPYGVILAGDADEVRRACDTFTQQGVDWDLTGEPPDPPDRRQVTIRKSVRVAGPGTFFGRERRTLSFEPTTLAGWWFDRVDQPGSLPIKVSVRNVWTTIRNIVLRSGSPHNYMRMVEHIIALRLGLGVDNLMIKADSGDPPLFDRGSMDLVEALADAGTEPQDAPVIYVTVKEPVTMGGANGSFLTLLPARNKTLHLQMDCAVDYPNAMGKQRVRFNLNRRRFCYGALARTNTTAAMKWYAQTAGKLFADIRNLGYTDKNILIAGRHRYMNEPLLIHAGKSLEAVWHRSLLDLLAALALIDDGRFVGGVVSYKAGHALDVEMVRILSRYGLLQTVENA
jgi:UDP-3-O-acyl-N-acetylglucosamine deacetylase